MEEQVGQLIGEVLDVLVGSEIALLPSPARDGVDHASDELLDRALPLGGPDLSAKVLGRDDIGRHLGPELGELHIALLEHHLAGLVRDHGGSEVPLDLVEWV